MPLSFPASIYGTVSPAAYLHANLTSPSSNRANGRSQIDFRKPIVNTNSLQHCHGSAVLRMGDTAVVCGIRGEILRADSIASPARVDLEDDNFDETQALKLLVPNVEMATGASPAFLPGNPPSTLAQSLSHRMYNMLHNTKLIDARDLRILYQVPKSADEEMEESDEDPGVEVKAYWTLYIDILFISLDGNPFDAAWGAMVAALANTKLPKAWWDADMDAIICSGQSSDAIPIGLRCFPVPATFAVFDARRHKGTRESDSSWILADPDAFEEQVCEETITVTWDGSSFRAIEKNGGTVVDKAALAQLLHSAGERWGVFSQALKDVQKQGG